MHFALPLHVGVVLVSVNVVSSITLAIGAEVLDVDSILWEIEIRAVSPASLHSYRRVVDGLVLVFDAIFEQEIRNVALAKTFDGFTLEGADLVILQESVVFTEGVEVEWVSNRVKPPLEVAQ